MAPGDQTIRVESWARTAEDCPNLRTGCRRTVLRNDASICITSRSIKAAAGGRPGADQRAHIVVLYSSSIRLDTGDALKVPEEDPAKAKNDLCLDSQKSEPKSASGQAAGGTEKTAGVTVPAWELASRPTTTRIASGRSSSPIATPARRCGPTSNPRGTSRRA
jgi:hypothetical protein